MLSLKLKISVISSRYRNSVMIFWDLAPLPLFFRWGMTLPVNTDRRKNVTDSTRDWIMKNSSSLFIFWNDIHETLIMYIFVKTKPNRTVCVKIFIYYKQRCQTWYTPILNIQYFAMTTISIATVTTKGQDLSQWKFYFTRT